MSVDGRLSGVVLIGDRMRMDSADLVPRLRAVGGPPVSRLDRTWNRVTRCAREGHVYRVAFPVGRYAHQCTRCGSIRPPMDVPSHVERWS